MKLIAVLALFYSAPAVTEQSWTGYQGWMTGQPCSTQIDRDEGTCNIEVIEFKKHGRRK